MAENRAFRHPPKADLPLGGDLLPRVPLRSPGGYNSAIRLRRIRHGRMLKRCVFIRHPCIHLPKIRGHNKKPVKDTGQSKYCWLFPSKPATNSPLADGAIVAPDDRRESGVKGSPMAESASGGWRKASSPFPHGAYRRCSEGLKREKNLCAIVIAQAFVFSHLQNPGSCVKLYLIS